MEGQIQGPDSGNLMQIADTLVNIQEIGRKCMKNIWGKMHTVGANMDIRTMIGRIGLLAQNVI
jgi:hypothetical protein